MLRGSADHAPIVWYQSKRLGFFSNRNGHFRDSGYDIVTDNGWQLLITTGVGNSANTAYGTTDFYIGRDPTGMKKVGTADRVASGTTFYRLGWDGQGPGKIGAFWVFQRVLSEQEMGDLWEATNSIYGIDTDYEAQRLVNGVVGSLACSVGVGVVESAVFLLDARTHTSGAMTCSKSGMFFDARDTSTYDGIKAWNFDNTYVTRRGGPTRRVGQFYTHAYWVKFRVTNSGWRTFFRGNDHWAIVASGSTELGYFSNRNGGFRSCNYHIDVDGGWQLLLAVGEGKSANTWDGTQTFYIGDANGFRQVGTTDRVASGTDFHLISYPGQGPGKLARIYFWDYALSPIEAESVYMETASQFGYSTSCDVDPAPSGTSNTLRSDVMLSWLAWEHAFVSSVIEARGTIAIPPTSDGIGDFPVTWPLSMTNVPTVVATIQGNGTFSFTLHSLSQSGAKFKVVRSDVVAGWTEPLSIDYVAITGPTRCERRSRRRILLWLPQPPTKRKVSGTSLYHGSLLDEQRDAVCP
jgi:hypothetical protein